jgi:hypothetical protein
MQTHTDGAHNENKGRTTERTTGLYKATHKQGRHMKNAARIKIKCHVLKQMYFNEYATKMD